MNLSQNNHINGKQFIPYNDYVDRPFGLKWGTAYAMDELKWAIERGMFKNQDVTNVPIKMSEKEIDQVLSKAYRKNESVLIYLNVRDEERLLKPVIHGHVRPFKHDQFLVEDQLVNYNDVHAVEPQQHLKWFQSDQDDLYVE